MITTSQMVHKDKTMLHQTQSSFLYLFILSQIDTKHHNPDNQKTAEHQPR